jgi:hypothetical protein
MPADSGAIAEDIMNQRTPQGTFLHVDRLAHRQMDLYTPDRYMLGIEAEWVPAQH